MPTIINYDQRGSFGQELKQLREEAGLTVEQLSEASGFNVGTIINVEAGKFSIKMDVANSLLGVLGYEVGVRKCNSSMNDYTITYNGIRFTERGLAELIYKQTRSMSTDSNTPIETRVYDQVKWVIEHCSNVNDAALMNALDNMWNNSIKVYNKEVQDAIDSVIGSAVKLGIVRHYEE